MAERTEHLEAVLLSAVRPSQEQEKRFLAFLAEKYGEGTTITWQKSDDYPDGFRLEVGAEVYDWSAGGRLSQFKDALEKLAATQGDVIPLLKETVLSWTPQAMAQEVGTVLTVGDGIARVDYPELVEHDLTKDQFRLYKLIWSRFIASQMENAVYDVTAIEAACGSHVFRATHQSLRFAGFTAIYEEGRDDEQEEALSALPDLAQGEALSLKKTDPQQHFTQPPARYTEATLVRAMEEKGVGRPSTYATIVSTIQDREYVVKKDKRLSPTPLGEVVNGLMMERFQNIISVEFTAGMEHQLDEVEEGKLRWKKVLEDFYAGFHQEMLDAEEALKNTRLKVPDEVTDEVCELCGRNMVIKSGRFGKFLACPGYPECSNTKPIVERMPGRCPRCGSTILKRKSKRGYAYYACERGQECGFMTWDVPTEHDCPTCGQTMFKRAGKGAMKPFCINESCPNFLPEDQRGYRRKPSEAAAATTAEGAAEAVPAEEKKAAKKTAAKKPAAKKTTTAKRPAAKKTTTAAKKPAARKKDTE